jgi:tetratricopeptide (TPR) repeat protein
MACGIVSGADITSGDSYAKGQAAFERKSYAEAAELLEQAEREHPKSTQALVLRAKALIHLDRYSEAEQALREYLAAHEGSADATYLLAYVLFRQDRPAQSLQEYTAAAQWQRPTADDFKIVGLDYVLLNDYPDAIHWLERAVAEAPNEAETLYDLGRAYYVQNDFDKAIAMFTRTLEIDPRSLKAKNNLGLALEGKNELDAAAKCYRDAIEIGKQTGKESDQPYINLAEWLNRKQQLQEALQMAEKAEQIGGKSERAEEVRGKVFMAEDRLGDAEQAFRAALAMDAKNGSLHYQLGRVLQREGKEQEARRQFAQTKALLGPQSKN